MRRRITGSPLLSPALLLRGYKARNKPPNSDVRFFSHARYALAQIVQEHRLIESPILFPSYICVDAVEPLESLGQTIIYYPIKENLEPDWEWLEQHLPPSAKAFMLIHYFGIPNSIQDAITFCKNHHLLLIEDCAHSLFSSHEGKATGTYGDFGIYSLRKFLPVLDGGLLINRNGLNGNLYPKTPTRFAGTPYRLLLRQLAKYFLARSDLLIIGDNGNGGRAISDLQPTAINGDFPAMSQLSYGINTALEQLVDDIVARRRDNYSYLLDNIPHSKEITPLYPNLPQGACPYLFPVLTENGVSVSQHLRSMGVPAATWPELPPSVIQNPQFDVAQRYAQQIITFPVHQDLSLKHLRRMVHSLDATVNGQPL